MPVTYVFRQTGKKSYEIAKFDENKEPDAVYHVLNDDSCDCFARAGNSTCKHVDALNVWKAANKPWGGFWDCERKVLDNFLKNGEFI